jgi:hypothetical protein
MIHNHRIASTTFCKKLIAIPATGSPSPPEYREHLKNVRFRTFQHRPTLLNQWLNTGIFAPES